MTTSDFAQLTRIARLERRRQELERQIELANDELEAATTRHQLATRPLQAERANIINAIDSLQTD